MLSCIRVRPGILRDACKTSPSLLIHEQNTEELQRQSRCRDHPDTVPLPHRGIRAILGPEQHQVMTFETPVAHSSARRRGPAEWHGTGALALTLGEHFGDKALTDTRGHLGCTLICCIFTDRHSPSTKCQTALRPELAEPRTHM